MIYKKIEYTDEQITAMREWATDCQWSDLDADGLGELSNYEILHGIEHHYDGGLKQFIEDNN